MIFIPQKTLISENSNELDLERVRSVLMSYTKSESEEALGEYLISVLTSPADQIREVMQDTKLSYVSIVVISTNITPEFWTTGAASKIKNKHIKFFPELDKNGSIKKENLPTSREETKSLLLRYFDLLPEEEDHDKELSEILLKLLKSDCPDLRHLFELTELNIASLIRLSKILSPKFWQSTVGKSLVPKLYQTFSVTKITDSENY